MTASQLASQNKMEQPVFSFRLAKQGSELYIGGTNKAKYSGEIEYHGVTSRSYWVSCAVHLNPLCRSLMGLATAHPRSTLDQRETNKPSDIQFRHRHWHNRHCGTR